MPLPYSTSAPAAPALTGRDRERLKCHERILQTAMEEFARHGIRAVKMDDIASQLSMSKRTLYEQFANKEELLMACIRLFQGKHDANMDVIAQRPGVNVIDIILEVYTQNMRQLADVVPEFFADLQRYPAVKAHFERKHKERAADTRQFFERGVAEGLFRADVDYRIATIAGEATMDYAMRTQLYRQYSLPEIMHNVFFLFLRGVCTAKGMELLEARLSAR